MKVIDCFIYNNEFSLLKARLEYLRDTCDLHIIVESNRYFSGSARQFSGLEVEELLGQFSGKIIWVKFNDESEVSTPWKREALQRNQIMHLLQGLDKNDLILLSDADEIPSKHFVEMAAQRFPECSIAMMEHFQYCLHLKNPNYSHTTIAFSIDSLDLDIQKLRMRAIKYWENPQEVITDAGWHLSSFGKPETFVDKIRQFSHQEFNKFPYTSVTYIRLIQYLGLQIDGSYSLEFVKNAQIPFDVGFECNLRHGIRSRRLLRRILQPIVTLIFSKVVKEISTPFSRDS